MKITEPRVCPKCGSHGVCMSGHTSTDPDFSYYVFMECQDCGTEFHMVYEFSYAEAE